jgi:hypothetical protein
MSRGLVATKTGPARPAISEEVPAAKGMLILLSPCGYGCALAMGGTWPIVAINHKCPEHGTQRSAECA